MKTRMCAKKSEVPVLLRFTGVFWGIRAGEDSPDPDFLARARFTCRVRQAGRICRASLQEELSRSAHDFSAFLRCQAFGFRFSPSEWIFSDGNLWVCPSTCGRGLEESGGTEGAEGRVTRLARLLGSVPGSVGAGNRSLECVRGAIWRVWVAKATAENGRDQVTGKALGQVGDRRWNRCGS